MVLLTYLIALFLPSDQHVSQGSFTRDACGVLPRPWEAHILVVIVSLNPALSTRIM